MRYGALCAWPTSSLRLNARGKHFFVDHHRADAVSLYTVRKVSSRTGSVNVLRIQLDIANTDGRMSRSFRFHISYFLDNIVHIVRLDSTEAQIYHAVQ